MSLHFDITGDNSNFLRKLDEARNGIRSTSKQIEESGMSIEQMFGRLAKSAAAFGAGITAKEIVSNIVRVRGEFQQLEVAFNTMLGSEQKAGSLMQQLVKTAATTPFDLQSVANGAKQLLAYGTAAEDVNGTLIRLGDIAAGLSIPLGDLVYLYGTTMSQGRLYTEDLNQFTGRGIPMIGELAKQFGVAESEVKKLVESGKVGFPEVKKVIESLTNEGGKFGGLMEAQSKTITGQISNIEDAIATMYNNLGKQSEGVINDALSWVSYLVENYEQVGKTVLELAATYGTYKAILISVAAYQSVAIGITYASEIAELSKLIPLKKQSANEDVIAAVASGKLSQAKAEQVISIRAEIAAKLQSLQATEAQTVSEHASAMSAYKSATQRMLIAKQNMALAQSQMLIAIKSGTVDEIAAAKKNAQTASLELNNAAIAKNSTHKTLNIAATNKKAAADAVSSFQTGVNTSSQVANTTSTNILTIAKTRLAAASKALGLSMLANPYVLTTAAIVGLGYGIYKLITYQTDAEKAQLKLNDSIKEAEKASLLEHRELSKLKGELSGLTKGTDEYNIVKDKIIKGFGKYYSGLDTEIEKVGLTEQAYNKLTEAINKSFGARQYEKFASEQQEELSNTMSENLGNIQDRLLKELGNEYGSKIYAKIRDGVMRGSLSLGKSAFDIKGLDSETKLALDKAAGKDGGLFDITNRSIEGYISNIIVANKATEELDKKARERFGVEGSSDKSTNTTTVNDVETKTASEWLSHYKKTYEEADKAYNDFLKSKQVMSESDRDKELEKLKGLRDTAKATYEGKGGSASSDTKQESAADKLHKEQEKLTEDIKKSIQERKELLIKSEMDIQQQQIDLKEEGTEKELAQIQLNYDRQYQEIAKRERELLEKLQNEERKQWEKDNPNYEKKGLKFTPKTTSLTPEQKLPFDKEYSLAFQKQDKDTQSMLDKLLEKYRDFDAQRTAIEKDGNADIAALQAKRTNENAAEIDRAITVAKQKMKEGIQAVTDTEASKTAEDNPFLKNLFGDTSQMAFKDLQNLIEQAKQVQAYLSNNGSSEGLKFISTEQLKNIEKSPDELDKLKKALDKLLKGEKGNEWDDIFEGFTKGLAKVKSAKGFKEFSEGMQDIGESASKASSMIGGVAGNLSSMFEEMGNTGAADAMSGVQDAMNAISNIGQGFAKGGIVGGIAAAVGEAANFIGKAFAANARHKAALQEIMNETIAQQREYNLLLMQQNLEYEKATTIFGTDVYGKAANAVKVMKDVVSDLNTELKGSGTYSKGYSFSIKNGVVDDLTKAQRDLYNAYEGLAKIEIKTGHKKTGLFGWGKGKDIYSSILSVYPELIKANGEFDASLAETILNTREMSDESKKSLQNMIDLANQAKEAYEAINDYFTDIFGELGNTMGDALVDAFRNGTDAAQAFTDSVSNMLETLAKQMIYSVTLAPMMEKAQKEMMDVMQNVGLSDEQKFSKWTGILDGLVDDAVNQQGLANRLLEEYQQTAKDKGYEIFSPDKSTSQDSTQKGFEAMSQDTGNELNGRFTALQISNEEIKNSMLSMLSGVNLLSTSATANGITLMEIRNLAISSNSYLEDIAGFQKRIVNEFGIKLDSINKNIQKAL